MRIVSEESSSLELLQAGLAELAATDPVSWSDEQVRSDLPVLLTAVNQLNAVVAGVLGTFDVRDLSEADACRTTRTWLTAFGRMSQGAASGWLSRARLMRELPALAAAAARGDVSAEHLRKVGDLVEKIGVAAVRDYDKILADLAATTNPIHVEKACERIRAHVDPDGPAPDPHAAFERRGFTLSRSGSMFGVRGQFDAEGGAVLMTALDALMKPPTADDMRTPAQRRADAMVELCRTGLTGGLLPTVGGVRPQLGILITPKALLGGSDNHGLGNPLDGPEDGNINGNPLDGPEDGDIKRNRLDGPEDGDIKRNRLDGPEEVNINGNRSGGPDTGYGDGSDRWPGLTSLDGGLGRGLGSTDRTRGGQLDPESGNGSDPASAHGADQTDPCYRSPASDGEGPCKPIGIDPVSQAEVPQPIGTDPLSLAGVPQPIGTDPPSQAGVPQPIGIDPLGQAGVPPLPEPPWMNWAGDIPTELAQRIACDCEVWRAVLDPTTGLPLEVGRAHRIVPHWIRKALHARDRGCRWPGCDAPAAWTDAHHLFDWYYGGETNMDNLLSLCRYHHVRVHEGHWRIVLDHATGEVSAFRPDGTPYELGPSQPWTGPNTHRGDPPPGATSAKAA
jgi:hypothetical protein